MQTLAEIKDLLASRGLAPRKSLGQNFLVDHNLIRKLVDASGVGPGDLVLEVGPGTGALTGHLLERGADVIASELDRGLSDLLRETWDSHPSFTLIEGDCLAGRRSLAPALLDALAGRRFRVVANLPYGAASPIMSVLLMHHPECLGAWVTIQREVADRLVARPGTRQYGVLSVLAAMRTVPRRVASLPPACFWPRPDVTSAMVGMSMEPTDLQDMQGLADFLQKLFGARRKQLRSVLGPGLELPDGVEPTVRAESLSPALLRALFLASRSG